MPCAGVPSPGGLHHHTPNTLQCDDHNTCSKEPPSAPFTMSTHLHYYALNALLASCVSNGTNVWPSDTYSLPHTSLSDLCDEVHRILMTICCFEDDDPTMNKMFHDNNEPWDCQG